MLLSSTSTYPTRYHYPQCKSDNLCWLHVPMHLSSSGSRVGAAPQCAVGRGENARSTDRTQNIQNGQGAGEIRDDQSLPVSAAAWEGSWPGPSESDPSQRGLETLEVFVEGMRSRDRRFLPPKTGLIRALQVCFCLCCCSCCCCCCCCYFFLAMVHRLAFVPWSQSKARKTGSTEHARNAHTERETTTACRCSESSGTVS